MPCVLPGQRTYTAYGQVKAEFTAMGEAARSSLRSVKASPTAKPKEAVHPHSALASDDDLHFLIAGLSDENLAQFCTPVVIFSSDRDGVSLSTLFKRCQSHAKESGHPETILLVQTASGEGLVGAFCSQAWEPGNEYSFYGNGESFLFRLRPSPGVIYKWDESEGLEKFQRATSTFIEVGGGLDSGPAGLRLDANLELGESGSSPTFGSECLITLGDDKVYAANVNEKAFCSFKISTVEVLGFVTA